LSTLKESFEGRACLGAFQPRGEMNEFLVNPGENLIAWTADEITGDLQSLGRFFGQFGTDCQRLHFHLIRTDDLPDQPCLKCRLGRENLTGHQKRKRPLMADDPRRKQA
jgi:hypothetical protein